MPQSQEIFKERYQLQSQLGINSGRQTWLAKDLAANDQLVVVKLLTFGGEVQWDDLKLFEREAQVLKQLAHSRIPKYLDYFSIDDRSLWFGLVQELISGSSLKDLLVQGQKFTEAQVKNIVTETLEILIYLHELNPPVLHRDIKPSNLIWSDRQEIYLVDFGAVQDKASAEGKTFTVVGTYGYAPMEQYGGRSVPASDLYGLGATTIHLLTGISPAELPQDDELNIQFRDHSGASTQFLDWIQKMTAPSPNRRYVSARKAIKALHLKSRQSSSKSSSKAKASNRKKIPQPVSSKVKISRSPTEYRVTIPPLIGSMIASAVLGLLAVLLILFFSFVILKFSALYSLSLTAIVVFPITLKMVYCGLITNWATILLVIDTKDFSCKLSKRTFGREHYLQEFMIDEVKYVHPIWKDQITEASSVVLNRVNGSHITLGDGRLNKLAAAWLSQEVQDCLRNVH